MYSYDDMPEPTQTEMREAFEKARESFKIRQKKIGIYPPWTVTFMPDHLGFYMGEGVNEARTEIRMTMDRRALYAMLQRKIHFNNLEVGCHIKIHREPNEYCPDIHTLLSFFHV